MPKDLKSFFSPKSVAIIGASRTPDKVGAIVLRNVIASGFKGKIYPINPKSTTIEYLQCYPDINSLPEIPELVIVAIPAVSIPPALTQIGEKGSQNVVIISAGFKEIGATGAKLEDEIVKIAQQYQLNLLGPNCLGFVNNLHPINATFGQLVNQAGNLRFISQSGAIAASLFDWAEATGLGFSDVITLGNKAGITENDILNYYQSTPVDIAQLENQSDLAEVTPIGLYLESIADGEEFLRITKEVSKNTPILMIKPGKTQAAATAMQSHTGAIAGADDVLDAVLKQAGVIRCQGLQEFFDFSRAFAWERLPKGPKVAIISNAGGPAVISADAVINEGLELAVFDQPTKAKLAEVLPRSASYINPIDLLGDALADHYAQAIEIILQTENVDSFVIILTPQLMTQIDQTAEVIGNLSQKYHQPIFCSFIGGSKVAEGEEVLNQYKIPTFRFPEWAISAIGAMWRFKQQRQAHVKEATSTIVLQPDDDTIRPIIQRAVNEKHQTLDSLAANEIVANAGILTPPTQAVTTLEEALAFTKKHGWPVVLKLSSPGLLHKKEVGGVITEIINAEELNDALHKLERKIDELDEKIRAGMQIQIQQDILHGVEVIIGTKYDPTFGPVLLFGAGGSYAELIDDHNLHLLPLELPEARQLVENSKVVKLLQEHDSSQPFPLEKLYEVIVRVGKLAALIPEATDIEINPAIITLNDVWAVDSKIVIKQAPKPQAVKPKYQVATTLKHKNLATQFHYYEFEAEMPLVFKPGQYISVKVAPDAVRAYSIATHSGPKRFNLLVDTRPGGPGSKFFENLKKGDKITYMGPFGVFTLNLDDGADHLLFLATGSGMSALRCMIDTALIEHKLEKPITLYFGLTHPQEIFWQDHFNELVEKFPNFNYEIVIFKPDENWHGPTGFITELVKENFADASKCAAYLCGHRAMIADGTELLLAQGCPKDRIYTERFV